MTLTPLPCSQLPDNSGYSQADPKCIQVSGIEGVPNEIFSSQEDTRERFRAIEAWKVLRARHNKCESSIGHKSDRTGTERLSSPRSSISGLKGTGYQPTNVVEQDFTTTGMQGNLECRFASMAATRKRQQAYIKSDVSDFKRHDSLPTPPEPKEQIEIDPIAAEFHTADFSSPPPSATGSASKCPIRFLDQHSPEEVARYFENHKHEIPRSHEICVKRYQSNSESIRQLDAKYGNLVSMIQGLGVKHQPLLPTKEGEDDEAAGFEQESIEKVEKWTVDCSDEHAGITTQTQDHDASGDDREGHFDRPLKEIRVGESPSRPWGISVPYAEGLALSISSGKDLEEEQVRERESIQQRHHETSTTEEPKGKCPFSNLGPNGFREKPEQRDEAAATPPAMNGVKTPKDDRATPKTTQAVFGAQPKMVFTGPVFIGYSAEQAAILLRQLGSGINVPHT